MKTIICCLAIFIASDCISQETTKLCGTETTKVMYEDESVNVPVIENYKGDFQIQLSASGKRTLALTDKFFELLEENRSQTEQVQIEMGNNNTLIIAPVSSLDMEGNGPFVQPFVLK